MSKAHANLDMNGKNINNVTNSTATTQHRANAHFDASGLNGITQVISFIADSVSHSFTFQGGILTAHSVKK